MTAHGSLEQLRQAPSCGESGSGSAQTEPRSTSKAIVLAPALVVYSKQRMFHRGGWSDLGIVLFFFVHSDLTLNRFAFSIVYPTLIHFLSVFDRLSLLSWSFIALVYSVFQLCLFLSLSVCICLHLFGLSTLHLDLWFALGMSLCLSRSRIFINDKSKPCADVHRFSSSVHTACLCCRWRSGEEYVHCCPWVQVAHLRNTRALDDI